MEEVEAEVGGGGGGGWRARGGRGGGGRRGGAHSGQQGDVDGLGLAGVVIVVL